MLVVEVVVPELRRDALGLRLLRHRVPQVDVRELRPHAQVRVRNVEQTPVDAETEPGIIEPELDAVGVLPDHEFLPGPAAKLGDTTFALTRQLLLGVRDEVLRGCLELNPDIRLGHELAKRQRGVALGSQPLDDAALKLVERRLLLCVAPSARAVGEQTIVHLVRGDHSSALEAARHAVDPRRELCPRPVHQPATLASGLGGAARNGVASIVTTSPRMYFSRFQVETSGARPRRRANRRRLPRQLRSCIAVSSRIGRPDGVASGGPGASRVERWRKHTWRQRSGVSSQDNRSPMLSTLRSS